MKFQEIKNGEVFYLPIESKTGDYKYILVDKEKGFGLIELKKYNKDAKPSVNYPYKNQDWDVVKVPLTLKDLPVGAIFHYVRDFENGAKYIYEKVDDKSAYYLTDRKGNKENKNAINSVLGSIPDWEVVYDFTDLTKKVEEVKKNTVISFKYEGGSNPGSTRLLFVQDFDGSNASGIDLEVKEYRNFSRSKMTDYKVLSHNSLNMESMPTSVKYQDLVSGYEKDGKIAVYLTSPSKQIVYFDKPKNEVYVHALKAGERFVYDGKEFIKVEVKGYEGNVVNVTTGKLTYLYSYSIVERK